MHQPARQSTNHSAHDRMHAVPHVSQALQPARPMVATRCPWGSRAPGRQRGTPADLGGANAGAGGQVVHAGLHNAGSSVEGGAQRQHICAIHASHLRPRRCADSVSKHDAGLQGGTPTCGGIERMPCLLGRSDGELVCQQARPLLLLEYLCDGGTAGRNEGEGPSKLRPSVAC